MSENDDQLIELRWYSASYYSRLAQGHVSSMEAALHRFSQLSKDGNLTREELVEVEYELFNTHNEAKDAAVSAILFAGMASEAYIYDYASRHLGKSFTDDHIETLNAESKWVVIPQLVTGQPFLKDRNSFRLLKLLIKARNGLVHSKSRNARRSEITSEAIKARDDELYESARDAVKALFALADEIEFLHPDENARFYLGVKDDVT